MSPVPLDGPSRTLLPLLDGTRDRAALVQCVLELMNQGSIVLQHDGEAVADPDVTRKAVTELVEFDDRKAGLQRAPVGVGLIGWDRGSPDPAQIHE